MLQYRLLPAILVAGGNNLPKGLYAGCLITNAAILPLSVEVSAG